VEAENLRRTGLVSQAGEGTLDPQTPQIRHERMVWRHSSGQPVPGGEPSSVFVDGLVETGTCPPGPAEILRLDKTGRRIDSPDLAHCGPDASQLAPQGPPEVPL